MLDILHWLELRQLYFLIAALVLLGVSYIWLTARACGHSWWWLIPPAPLFFPLVQFRRARGPLLVAVLAVLVYCTPVAANRVINLLPREPWDQIVEGKRHISLTNWGRSDYPEALKYTEDADAVFMANADVTDATLDLLKDHIVLTKLDLSKTQITDAGLAKLNLVPNLKEIWLVNTKITDKGFRDHLMNRDWIEMIDVTGTDVESKTLRQWKAARDGRRYVK